MPSIHFNYNNWWAWDSNQYPNQKVAFDGPNKIIYVNEGVTTLDVKTDLYSAWKEWKINSLEAPHPTAYLNAFTAVGGDPITDVQDLGTTYFLENGWRIQPFASKQSYTLTISGNLYTREPGETPFFFAEGVSVSLVRSNIVDLITVSAVGVSITEQDITNIANATADSVWDETLDDHQNVGSTGKKLRDNIKKNQYIALS
jgi:hypothetical protein